MIWRLVEETTNGSKACLPLAFMKKGVSCPYEKEDIKRLT
jgi:hypothetical protein